MSISSVSVISERIRSAKEHSPIAVFSVNRRNTNILNASFGSTVFTQKRIDEGGRDFVGEFYGHSGVAEFRNKVRASFS